MSSINYLAAKLVPKIQEVLEARDRMYTRVIELQKAVAAETQACDDLISEIHRVIGAPDKWNQGSSEERGYPK